MHKVKLVFRESWWVFPLMFMGAFVGTMQQYVGIPAWISYLTIALVWLFGSIQYSRRVWRRTAEEKEALKKKHAAEDAQLFGGNEKLSVKP